MLNGRNTNNVLFVVCGRGVVTGCYHTAVFSTSACIPRSQVRNITALLNSLLLGCYFITSLVRTNQNSLDNICCQSGVAGPSVVPSGQKEKPPVQLHLQQQWPEAGGSLRHLAFCFPAAPAWIFGTIQFMSLRLKQTYCARWQFLLCDHLKKSSSTAYSASS